MTIPGNAGRYLFSDADYTINGRFCRICSCVRQSLVRCGESAAIPEQKAIVVSTHGSSSPGLMLNEAFAAGDDGFLNALIQVDSPELLLELLPHWLADARPWARQQVADYLNLELNFPGHEVVVKRLFRHFESARDHWMMARFMVAFDRLVRRRRTRTESANSQDCDPITQHSLRAESNRTVKPQSGRSRREGFGMFGRTVPLPDLHNLPGNRLFGHPTRNHLRRRVWRYFRWLSYADPVAYLAAVSEAIILYREDDVGTGDTILDNWSLMHACSFGTAGLSFSAAHANCQLSETTVGLMVSPYQPELWQHRGAAENLIEIVLLAGSSWCRVWAKKLLLRDHSGVVRSIIDCDRGGTGRLRKDMDAAVGTWCSDLLGIHLRGFEKRKALTAIQSAIHEQPSRSSRLLPILAGSVRSDSAPERRHALAAVATLNVQRPQLRVEIANLLPELDWGADPSYSADLDITGRADS